MNPDARGGLPSTRELSGTWEAAACTEELRRTFSDPGELVVGDAWHPTAVPGHWRRDPQLAGHQGPVLYRHRFEDTPAALHGGRRAWLGFGGVFALADVWLDGDLVSDLDCWFRPQHLEVTEQLARGAEHLLAVEVSCAPPAQRHRARSLTGVFQHWDLLDDGANPGGIWRPVVLRHTGPVRIARHRVLCAGAGADRATVAVQLTLDSLLPRPVGIRCRITEAAETAGSGGNANVLADEVHRAELVAGETTQEWILEIPDPPLWWPRSLGPARLVDLDIEVLLDDDDAERAATGDGGRSDAVSQRSGLRSVEMSDLVLEVNGERLFTKGAVQGPLRAAPGEEGAGDVARFVQGALATGLDLVRFAGHVPTPEVLDACDAAGLLAWVDLPLVGGQHRSVRRAATAAARHLVDAHGHHPCVALWCAHDEPLPAAGAGRWIRAQLPSWNRDVLDPAVARALRNVDGTRPVLASSGTPPHPPTFDGTDWRVTLPPAGGPDLRRTDGLLSALGRLARFVTALPGPSAKPDAAELRHLVAALRRRRFRPTGGFAVGLLTAADGIAEDVALVRHDGTLSPAGRAMAEACAPVAVLADRLPRSLRPGGTAALDVHLVNDLRHPVRGRVTAEVHLERADGATSELRRGWVGTVPADSVVRVGTVAVWAPPEAAGGRLRLEVGFDGGGNTSRWTDSASVTRRDARTAHRRGRADRL